MRNRCSRVRPPADTCWLPYPADRGCVHCNLQGRRCSVGSLCVLAGGTGQLPSRDRTGRDQTSIQTGRGRVQCPTAVQVSDGSGHEHPHTCGDHLLRSGGRATPDKPRSGRKGQALAGKGISLSHSRVNRCKRQSKHLQFSVCAVCVPVLCKLMKYQLYATTVSFTLRRSGDRAPHRPYYCLDYKYLKTFSITGRY
jgi:ribosomal protein L37E